MEQQEMYDLMDKALSSLYKGGSGTIPSLILDQNKYPRDIVEENKLKIIEEELIERKLVEVFNPHYDPESLAAQISNLNANPGGFRQIFIVNKGRKLIQSGKSVASIFEAERKKDDQERELKEATLSNQKFLEKNQKLEKELKVATLRNQKLQTLHIINTILTSAVTSILWIILWFFNR